MGTVGPCTRPTTRASRSCRPRRCRGTASRGTSTTSRTATARSTSTPRSSRSCSSGSGATARSSATDLEPRAAIDWYWRPTNQVRAILEALAEAGILGLSRRDGQPAGLRPRRAALPRRAARGDRGREDEQRRHKLLSRYRAHGLLGTGGQAEIFLGPGPDPEPDPRPRGLVEAGTLVPAEVEGVKGQRYRRRRGPRPSSSRRAASSPAGRRPAARRPGSRSSPRSTRSPGIASCCGACGTSTTSGRCTSRRRSAAGATTCCRSCSATDRRAHRAAVRPQGGRAPRPRRLVGGRRSTRWPRSGVRPRVRRGRRGPRPIGDADGSVAAGRPAPRLRPRRPRWLDGGTAPAERDRVNAPRRRTTARPGDRPSRAVPSAGESFVYGTIATLIAMAGFETVGGPSRIAAGAIIAVSAIATWFAHAYLDDRRGARLASDEPITVHEVVAALREAWPIVDRRGPGVRPVASGHAGPLGRSRPRSSSRTSSAIAVMAIAGFLAARSARAGVLATVGWVVVTAAIGATIVVVEAGRPPLTAAAGQVLTVDRLPAAPVARPCRGRGRGTHRVSAGPLTRPWTSSVVVP